MNRYLILILALGLSGCPAQQVPPPPPPTPTNTTDVMTMLGVQSLEELQTNFREEETRDANQRLTEKRWYDATDSLRLRKVYVYDEQGREIENVFFDGNGERLYTFRMVYDEQGNRIGENLYNDKDELISTFTYDIPIPAEGTIAAPPPSQNLDPTLSPTNRPTSAAQEPTAVPVPQGRTPQQQTVVK